MANDAWTELSVKLPEKQDFLSAMFVCPGGCAACVDESTTGNCGLLPLLAAHSATLVEEVCNDATSGGVGDWQAGLCERTCDDIVGGKCP